MVHVTIWEHLEFIIVNIYPLECGIDNGCAYCEDNRKLLAAFKEQLGKELL